VRPLKRLVIMNVPHPGVFAEQIRRSPRQMLRSWYMFFFQIPGLPERLNTANDARAIRRAFVGMAVDKSRFPAEVLDRYALDARRPGAMTGMVNWYRAAARHPGKLAGPWPRIETPTLVIWGEEDAALGLELLDGTDRRVADLTIRRLPGVSHWVQQEAPEAVNAILAEWLAAPRPA
jgi:pimeloyl-ACP methyl ester carboxylesterase